MPKEDPVSAVLKPNGNSVEIETLFREVANDVARLASGCGVSVIPYRHHDLPIFGRLAIHKKLQIINDLTTYRDICQATLDETGTALDMPRLVWYALRKSGLRPSSDLFKYIPAGNTIEIHNREGVQIFRSLSFYKICSYSLEELYSSPWTELYEHDAEAYGLLVGLSKKFFEENLQEVVPLQMSPHLIRETQSELHLITEADMKYVAPLFEDGTSKVAAHLTIEDTRNVSASVWNARFAPKSEAAPLEL